MCFFFFQAEDGIRYATVTGVQTCALPISLAGGEAMDANHSLNLVAETLRIEGPDRGSDDPIRKTRPPVTQSIAPEIIGEDSRRSVIGKEQTSPGRDGFESIDRGFHSGKTPRGRGPIRRSKEEGGHQSRAGRECPGSLHRQGRGPGASGRSSEKKDIGGVPRSAERIHGHQARNGPQKVWKDEDDGRRPPLENEREHAGGRQY